MTVLYPFRRALPATETWGRVAGLEIVKVASKEIKLDFMGVLADIFHLLGGGLERL